MTHPESLAKISCTSVTTIMWSPNFVLIFNFATKVMVVCLFNHCSYVTLLWCKRHLTANVTEVIWIVHTISRHLSYSSLEIYLTNVILEAVTWDLWCKSQFLLPFMKFLYMHAFYSLPRERFLQIKAKSILCQNSRHIKMNGLKCTYRLSDGVGCL